jgi:hypothetical protein
MMETIESWEVRSIELGSERSVLICVALTGEPGIELLGGDVDSVLGGL